MAKFGDSIHNYMLAGNEADQATALTSAHVEFDNALSIKPTPTEVDEDFKEFRQQGYAAVMSGHSSVFGFDINTQPERTYWNAGKQSKSW